MQGQNRTHRPLRVKFRPYIATAAGWHAGRVAAEDIKKRPPANRGPLPRTVGQ